MHIKDIKNKLKVLKKRAQGSVGTAIKVLTATVLGASILVGGYALTNEVVLPNTTEKVESMFAYSEDAAGGTGGSGTVEPTPEGPQIGDVRTFHVLLTDMSGNYTPTGQAIVLNYEYGMTWADFVNSSYNPSDSRYSTGRCGYGDTLFIVEDESHINSCPDEMGYHSGVTNVVYSDSASPYFDYVDNEGRQKAVMGDMLIDENIQYLIFIGTPYGCEVVDLNNLPDDDGSNGANGSFGETKTFQFIVEDTQWIIEGDTLEQVERPMEFTYEDGMTWRDFCESTYSDGTITSLCAPISSNTFEFEYIENDLVGNPSVSAVFYIDENGNRINPKIDDPINENIVYRAWIGL